jgi:hypothetical protein
MAFSRAYLLWLALAPYAVVPLGAQNLPAGATHGQANLPLEAITVSPCRVEEVLPGVTLHVKEFVENVNRFTASELVERERMNYDGKVKEKWRTKSDYVATIQKMDSGFFVVTEYRNQTQGEASPRGTITANITAALALIFLPSHIEEFDMTCEGPADWHGRSTWQIRFQQRMDRPSTMTSFRAGDTDFTVFLKGSAWIDSDNFEIVHLETDLLQPIPQMRLDTLHQSVDFGAVTFSERNLSLWLPRVAEVTADFRGNRLVERHIYSRFRLFFVDTGQKIGKPAESSN